MQALNSAREKSTQHVARIRLAQLMLSQREFTETLELLNLSEMDGLDSHYHELRGDAYRGLNQIDKAREEYETSLERSVSRIPVCRDTQSQTQRHNHSKLNSYVPSDNSSSTAESDSRCLWKKESN